MARLVVMTARTAVAKGETLTLKIIALDKQPVKAIVVNIRSLGRGDWQSIPVTHVARAVYKAELPAVEDDFEYRVEAVSADGKTLMWPATAPTMNQTVVVTAP